MILVTLHVLLAQRLPHIALPVQELFTMPMPQKLAKLTVLVVNIIPTLLTPAIHVTQNALLVDWAMRLIA